MLDMACTHYKVAARSARGSSTRDVRSYGCMVRKGQWAMSHSCVSHSLTFLRIEERPGGSRTPTQS